MRVLALQADVLVLISAVWQTTCTAMRQGSEGFVIDSPVYPDELEAVGGLLEQAGFPVSGLLATHGDWDHLLGRLAFPDAALGVGEATYERLRRQPGQPQRELRAFDGEHYVRRSRPLALGSLQRLPVPGRLSLGEGGAAELELHRTAGHTDDGIAILVPWARLLIAGDYLSPVEIPMLGAGGSVDEYLATLERLAVMLSEVDTVIPGHGEPIGAAAARSVLDEDVAYLASLHERRQGLLPASRDSPRQRRIHAENLARLRGQGTVL